MGLGPPGHHLGRPHSPPRSPLNPTPHRNPRSIPTLSLSIPFVPLVSLPAPPHARMCPREGRTCSPPLPPHASARCKPASAPPLPDSSPSSPSRGAQLKPRPRLVVDPMPFAVAATS